MAAFLMRRIPVPGWAPEHLVRASDGDVVTDLSEPGGPEAYAIFQPRRAEIVDLIDRAVNDYINDDGLTYAEGEDGFPTRNRLSGEYYLGRSFYLTDSSGYGTFIMARCLEKPWYPGQIARDYLGLGVVIELDSATGALSVSGVHSSSI